MILTNLLHILNSKEALIVHCARSNRGGELKPKPLYPNDLADTIRDLATGGVRAVSCSVVWPTHQDTFGEIGIIVKPRNVGEIVRLSTGDAGTLEDGDGFGEPLSSLAVDRTFAHSTEHNEWVLTGGDVVGVFLNFKMGLRVARLISVKDAEALGVSPPGPYPFPVTVADVAADFPGRRLFGFVGGVLMEIDPTGKPIAACHPY
ncbi:hypothetical protein J2Y55_004554 [Bosea sp. BE125]|uniref:hypothetical protein n=1 Tax=Bosea sp. BE125 TaxID=2817909 RepID=UPI00285BF889|nr:hypothetical protein [Bosea sp. BE125]MDR6873527.1 hypothetical protein [Bosea sp. BE125]